VSDRSINWLFNASSDSKSDDGGVAHNQHITPHRVHGPSAAVSGSELLQIFKGNYLCQFQAETFPVARMTAFLGL